ncbi:MAG: hypothetical protein K0S58_3396 [Nitrospira sp.]|jgi:hypothetical protein|nr:hypothetical protein [Nitrospira sp.]
MERWRLLEKHSESHSEITEQAIVESYPFGDAADCPVS